MKQVTIPEASVSGAQGKALTEGILGQGSREAGQLVLDNVVFQLALHRFGGAQTAQPTVGTPCPMVLCALETHGPGGSREARELGSG